MAKSEELELSTQIMYEEIKMMKFTEILNELSFIERIRIIYYRRKEGNLQNKYHIF